MKNKTVGFHAAAAQEYEAAFDWYFERSEEAASRFASELEQAILANPASLAGLLERQALRVWPQPLSGNRLHAHREFLLFMCLANLFFQT